MVLPLSLSKLFAESHSIIDKNIFEKLRVSTMTTFSFRVVMSVLLIAIVVGGASSYAFLIPSHNQLRIPTKLNDSFLDDQAIINTKLLQLSSSNSSSSQRTRFGSSLLSSHQEQDGGGELFTYARRRVNNRHAANDWLHNIASIPKSTVLRDIKNPLLTIFTWSSFISIIHKCLASNQAYKHLAMNMAIGTQMHSLMISSLGLLLVFRTNSAYQRFVEGRKIWEQILGIARNIDRMVNVYSEEIGEGKKYRIKHYLASFPYLLRHHIRPRCLGCDNDTPAEYRMKMEELPFDFVETRHEGDKSNGGLVNSDEYSPDNSIERPHYCTVDKRSLPWSLLDEQALARCSNAINRPLWACNSIADEVVSIPYGPNFTSRERLTLLSSVDKLSNAIGQCERIHQTAVPLNYARHALRGLSLWLFTLPFALVKDLGLLTGPICGITTWLMFGVYQIGHSIEDPFQKTLRLSILCNNIRRDVLGENQYRRTQPAVTEISPSASIVGHVQEGDVEEDNGHNLLDELLPQSKSFLSNGSAIIEPITIDNTKDKYM